MQQPVANGDFPMGKTHKDVSREQAAMIRISQPSPDRTEHQSAGHLGGPAHPPFHPADGRNQILDHRRPIERPALLQDDPAGGQEIAVEEAQQRSRRMGSEDRLAKRASCNRFIMVKDGEILP